VHLYNRAVEMRPPDQPLPESARKLRDTLRTQNTPPGADGREGGTR
jgi:hypothetical protein